MNRLYLKTGTKPEATSIPLAHGLAVTEATDPHRLIAALSCGCGWTDDFSQIKKCTNGCVGCSGSICPACGEVGATVMAHSTWVRLMEKVEGEEYMNFIVSRCGVIGYGGPYPATFYVGNLAIKGQIDSRVKYDWENRN